MTPPPRDARSEIGGKANGASGRCEGARIAGTVSEVAA